MTLTAIEKKTESPPAVSSSAWRRRALVVVSDLLAIVSAGAVASWTAGSLAPRPWAFAVFGLAMWAWMGSAQLYNSRLVTDRAEELPRIGRSAFRALLLLALVMVVLRQPMDLRAAFALFLSTVLIVSLEREALRGWFASRRKSGQALWATILVANETEGAALKASIDSNKSSPHVILDVIDPESYSSVDELLTKALAAARAVHARGVVIDESSIDRTMANRFVRGLLEAQLFVDLASPLSDISTERLASRNLGPSVATWIAPRPRDGWRARAKRAFDVAATSAGLLVLTPVFVGVALAVKLSSPGPIFFRQERVGRDRKPFGMLKFRSMVVDAEELLDELDVENEGSGPLFKMKSDPRVTKVGRFIRKTSLDELPQLINVLRNEMSLVGPRPALHAEMAEWDPDLFARLQVKPGITGMWQVSGRSTTTFDEYTRLDLYYVHNWSLQTDLSILARTIPAVLKSDGAF